jgi:hypothetical protein
MSGGYALQRQSAIARQLAIKASEVKGSGVDS